MLRGAWETFVEYIFELCTEHFMYIVSRLQRSGERYNRWCLVGDMRRHFHVSGMQNKVVTRDNPPRPYMDEGIFCISNN